MVPVRADRQKWKNWIAPSQFVGRIEKNATNQELSGTFFSHFKNHMKSPWYFHPQRSFLIDNSTATGRSESTSCNHTKDIRATIFPTISNNMLIMCLRNITTIFVTL
mmetsp:Transcript_30415/g.63279  ORF Transcript_30415/g.63279 Transcript_30415/m.63279 type:complete len:107 (-) Transcript_30415:216-536(-)